MTNRLPRSFLRVFGARLGILAIALQLVLSFAHIHPLTPPEPTIAAQSAETGGSGDLPLAAGDCAVCANIAAFSSLALPTAAVFAVSTSWISIVLPELPVWTPVAAAYRLFRTRAPPAAQNH